MHTRKKTIVLLLLLKNLRIRIANKYTTTNKIILLTAKNPVDRRASSWCGCQERRIFHDEKMRSSSCKEQ
jgi:hypothetical protein